MPQNNRHYSSVQRPQFPARNPWVLWIVLVCAAGLSACSAAGSRSPATDNFSLPYYKIDIVQGNVVTREQAEALRPGMARDQVRDVLGSPLLTSVFHADRWDYVFTFRRQGQPTQNRRLTVFFKNAVLERFDADELPSEAEFVASLDASRKSAKVPVLQATPEQLKAFAVNADKDTPTLAVPASNYPPLEATGVGK